MAAVLKKRALAEFSQVIQQEEQQTQHKPVKKLRLARKIRTADVGEVDLTLLTDTTNTRDALQVILQLGEALPLRVDDVQSVLRRLLDFYHKTKEAAIRAKLISLMADIVRTSKLDPSAITDDFLFLLRAETSHKVIARILETLLTLVKSSTAPVEGKLQQRLLVLASQYLNDNSHLVKSKCLEMISDLTAIENTAENINTTMKILGEYSRNQDPRVRTTAFEAMLKLHERGLKLDISVYDEVSLALTDDYESVRIVALKLLSVLGSIYAENLVPVPNSQEQIRLADDTFAKICNTVNDLSMAVRVKAAELLGSVPNVSSRFLEQTLDKKLMSHLRRKRSAHERQKENYESGEWATGQKWADDAPKEAVDADSISMINSGACGAIVHGLEDEFLEVRSATVDSLTKLAVSFPSFALQSIDFLVDMFNDEIEDVRLKAIYSLTTVSKHIVLREDQLETILAVLEDFSMDIREGLHEMLGNCHLSTKACLKMCIDHLLENLKRYPQDRRSIWKCLQKLGAKHPELTLPLVPDLLGIHPYLDMPEPDMDDPAYMSVLILVFNAAANCPTMIPLLEQHTLRHYLYLQDSLPHLVPHLKIANVAETAKVEASANTQGFLQQVLDRVSNSSHMSLEMRQNLFNTAVSDLQRLSEIDPSSTAAANCASLYIRCQSLFAKLLHNKSWFNPSSLALQLGHTVKNAVKQILRMSFQLGHTFSGLSHAEMGLIHQIRLRALALQLVYIVCGSNSAALALCEYFLDQVDNLQRFLMTNQLQTDAFTAAVFTEMDQLDDPKPGAVARLLQPILQLHDSPSLQLSSKIQQAKATIHDPTGESDNPVKFTAGLVIGVHLDAELEHVSNLKVVRIQVKYPDQQVHLILPRMTDFREISPNHHRIITTVLLSHSIWSEPCHVEIGLVLDYSESELSAIRAPQKQTTNKMDDYLIDLGKPVKVYISPKLIKKGI